MTVIVITETSYGIIGVVKNKQDMIDYLIDTHWLNEYTELKFTLDNNPTVIDYFGESWKNILKAITLEEFNRLFDDSFYCSEEEVWERDNSSGE